MKKRLIVVLVLSACLLSSCTNREETLGFLRKIIYKERGPINCEDIQWKVEPGRRHGERVISFNYQNNTDYTIVSADMVFKKKENVTEEQLSVFDELRESEDVSDEEIIRLEIWGYNNKLVKQGSKVSRSLLKKFSGNGQRADYLQNFLLLIRG